MDGLPLARPAVASVAIFTFLYSWNLHLEPIVYLSMPEKFTLPQAFTQFTRSSSSKASRTLASRASPSFRAMAGVVAGCGRCELAISGADLQV